MIDEILKNSDTFKRVLKDIKNGHQPHSYLFSSPDKFSAHKIASLTAQALLCQEMCGKCENCIKFNAEHPDVKFFPTKEKLLVDDSNTIVDESFIKPIFSDKKIFVIYDIDASTDEAQNKLLKVLEEPNSCVYYILTTSNMQAVLPTIKSRCFKMEIGAFSQDLLKKEIDLTREEGEIALALGGGYIGKTIELSKKQNLKELFDLSVSLLCDMRSSKEVLSYSKRVQDFKADIRSIFEIMAQALEDFIAIKNKQNNLVRLSAIKSKLEARVGDYSMKAICEIQKLLTEASRELTYFANPVLVLDNLLMNILEVKYICR